MLVVWSCGERESAQSSGERDGGNLTVLYHICGVVVGEGPSAVCGLEGRVLVVRVDELAGGLVNRGERLSGGGDLRWYGGFVVW